MIGVWLTPLNEATFGLGIRISWHDGFRGATIMFGWWLIDLGYQGGLA